MLFIMFSEYPSKATIASLLKVSERHLNYLLYVLAREKEQYHLFQIPKRDGGIRTIEAPAPALKKVQRRLSNLLYENVPIKPCAYAFCKGKDKGIKWNANRHKRKKWVINIDIKDFFPSIHFGRVRGLFLSAPFNCTEEAATILAQLACFNGHLAQGAPSSPIISNLICRRLDNRLIDFARDNKITYTRYADDITFSTKLSEIPAALGSFEDGKFALSDELRHIIEDENGFQINNDKVHYATRQNRQQVTGLVVNEKVNVTRHYIREIRGMLYAWKAFGKKAAAIEHYHSFRPMDLSNPEERFGRELQGRINYVRYIRGKEDRLYAILCQKFWDLEPKAKLKVRYNSSSCDAVVFCEGESDSFHLKAALQSFQDRGQFTDLRVVWYKYGKDQHMNNAELKKLMLYRAKWKERKTLEVFLFDRDDLSYLDMEMKDSSPISYGRGVYSMLLPTVPHRKSPRVCIEHLYENADLLKKDSKGHRVFLSTEFDPSTAHCSMEDVTTSNRKALRSDYEYIIDDNVFNRYGQNVALAKVAFGKNVLNRVPPFDVMDFTHFAPVFEKVRKLILSEVK